MANPVLRSPYAAFGYLPSNGDDGVVADERRAAYKPRSAQIYDIP